MEKGVEREFFRAFERGTWMIFDFLEQKYNLRHYISKENEEESKECEEAARKGDGWRRYYGALPGKIKKEAAAFAGTAAYDDIIMGRGGPLLDEIEDNIDSLTGKQRERYVRSILEPFTGFSDRTRPTGVIRRLKELKGDYESRLAKESEEGRACLRKEIENLDYRIERARYVAERYRRIMEEAHGGETVEAFFYRYCRAAWNFAACLDRLLLERGINLLWYQRECRVYLVDEDCEDQRIRLFESRELGMKYVNEALPKLDGRTQGAASDAAAPEAAKGGPQRKAPGLPEELAKRLETAVETLQKLAGRTQEAASDAAAPEAAGRSGKGRPGRPSWSFDYYCHDKTNLQALHDVMDGPIAGGKVKGKKMFLVMQTAVELGWLVCMPSFESVKKEFGDFGYKSGYHYFLQKDLRQEDINRMKETLTSAKKRATARQQG